MSLHPISANPAALIGLQVVTLAWADMTDAQRAAALTVFGTDAPDRYETIGFGPRPKVDSKFYTPHLRPEQSAEFYELWRAGKVVWGYPGGPYRPLFLPGLSPPASQ